MELATRRVCNWLYRCQLPLQLRAQFGNSPWRHSSNNGATQPEMLGDLQNLGLGRRQFTGGAHGLESDSFMRPVAKRFVLGGAAAAQSDRRASAEAEFFPVGIVNCELAFDADGPVVENRNFGWHHHRC